MGIGGQSYSFGEMAMKNSVPKVQTDDEMKAAQDSQYNADMIELQHHKDTITWRWKKNFLAYFYTFSHDGGVINIISD